MEDLTMGPPKDIDPYKVLELETAASPEQVKSAYKKLALRHHPDKVAESARDAAHVKFQEIAFAYAILSEPRRRQRYDATGNISDSIDIDDDFDWNSYFKARFADSVTGEKLNNFKDSYQHSEEEERDVLAAYKATNGNMDKVFNQVMLSNPLYDEARFRQIIQKAIDAGEVEAYTSFLEEPDLKKTKRQRRAAQESAEAMEYAKELGVYDALFKPENVSTETYRDGRPKPRTKKKERDSQKEAVLAGLIQKNRMAKSSDFLDNLEVKYVGVKEAEDENRRQKGKRRTKRKLEEPPEELFQKNRQKMKRTPEAEEEEDEEDEDMVDLETGISGWHDDEDDEEEEVKQKEPKGKIAKGHRGGKSGAVKKAKVAATNDVSSRKAPSRKAAAKR